MPILLPIAVFVLLSRALLHHGDSTRESLLRAAILSVTILVTITELLSIPYLITRAALIVAWSITFIAILFFTLRSLKKIPAPPRPASRPTIHVPSHLIPIDIALAATIAILLAIIGAIAILAPPNTADAMEYHLPRIIFWVSNHTVRNYPTPDYAQLIQGPLAEFITLHTHLLFGSDRLVNLVEFSSLIGSAIAVSLITGKFGTGRTGQLFAALFVVTIPEAVLESSGAMTTVAVSFWIITACYFTLRAVKDRRTFDVVTAAFAIGLALLTKGIAFIYLPFVVFGCIFFRPAPRRTWMLRRLPVLILIALAINTPQFIRAYQATGTLLAADAPLIKSQTANLLHFILLTLAFAALPFIIRKLEPKHRSLIWYAAGIVCTFIALCAIVQLHPCGSRSFLPLFILSAAIIGVVSERIFESVLKTRVLIAALSAMLVLNTILFVIPGGNLLFRPMLHRPTDSSTSPPLPAPQESAPPPSSKP